MPTMTFQEKFNEIFGITGVEKPPAGPQPVGKEFFTPYRPPSPPEDYGASAKVTAEYVGGDPGSFIQSLIRWPFESIEQLFHTVGAVLTTPYRAKELGELAREYPIVSPLPGGRGYKQYLEWKESPEEPSAHIPLPTWRQWGAWLKPLLENDWLLNKMGIDPSQWEEPERYEWARWGLAEMAEFAPLLFLGGVAKKPAEELLKSTLKQTAKGTPVEEAVNIAFSDLAKKGKMPLYRVGPPLPVAEEVAAKPIAERVMPKQLALAEPTAIEARITEIDKLLRIKGKLPRGKGTKEQLRLESANLKARQDLAKFEDLEQLNTAIAEVERELGNRSMPYHGGEPGNLFPDMTAKQLDETLKVYEAARVEMARPVIPTVLPKVAPEVPTEVPAFKLPVIAKTEMPTIEELIAANYEPRVAALIGEKLVKAPGIVGSINKSLLPMQTAKTAPERASIAWMALKDDIAPSLARLEMDVVYAKDFPFKFAPPVYRRGVLPLRPIEEGLVRGVIPRDPRHRPFIQAIAEFPDRYILTEAQRAELKLLDDILQRQLTKELAAEVGVRPVGLAVGQRYMPRFVKELIDLETKAIKEVRRGVSTRPGGAPTSFRSRYYEEVLDGIVKGKVYTADLRAAVEMRLTAGNKAIADKKFADFLRPLGKLPKERISPALRQAREDIVSKRLALRNISGLIEQINAGVKIDWPYWLGIKRWYPKKYATLRMTVKEGRQVPDDLLRWVISEKTALKATSRRITPKYKVALARARGPILGKEGAINHAGLQGEIFPIDIADPVNALIRKEITASRVLGQLAKVNDVARMGQTAIDTGFGLIQGLLTLANHPGRWGEAFVNTFKTLVNPKYVARWNTIPKHAATRRTITTHGGASFGGSEFTMAARAGGWLEKIPVVGKIFRRFGRAFEDYLDTARILVLEAKLPHYTRKLKRKLTDTELTDLVVTTDHMVGISSMSRLGISKYLQTLARNGLYAPRYYLAFVSFLGRAFQGGVGGDMARTSLAKLLVAMPAFMSVLAYSLGQKERVIPTKDKPIPRMFDPRTGEFMTVEIAGVHMGIGGVWVAAFRLLGSLTRAAIDDPMDFLSIDPHENPILRYGYGRAAPVASAAIDVFTGKNYLGERLDTIDDYLREVIDKTFPFWLAGAITDVPKSGWQKGLAEWWGLRAWMVQHREQAKRYAEEHIKDIPEEMIMPWQREKGVENLTADDLNNEQRAWLLLTFEDYREAQDKIKEDVFKKGTDFQVMDAYIRDELNATYHADLEEIAKGILAGAITIEDYQDQTEYLRRIRQGQYQRRALEEKYMDADRIKSLEEWLAENEKPEDVAFDKYMELRGNPPKRFGKPDWDAWKRNIDAYLDSLDAETRAYIERKRNNWINDLPASVQQVERLILESETILDEYYAIPQGQPRLDYRRQNPEVDAKLALLGRVSTFRSTEASQYANILLIRFGIPAQAIPAYIKAMERGEPGPSPTLPGKYKEIFGG